MALGGKVEGVTSDEMAVLGSEIRRCEADGLKAIVDFYVASSDAEREEADRRAVEAFEKARSAKDKHERLARLQDEHQARKEDVAAWLRIVLADNPTEG